MDPADVRRPKRLSLVLRHRPESVGILAHGLEPRGRRHVHLSRDVETARRVGARRGSPAVLRLDASGMAATGATFWLSTNGSGSPITCRRSSFVSSEPTSYGRGMTGNKKSWSDLTERQRRLVVAGAAAELLITSVAARDLARRSHDEVRGPKALWAVAFSVQPVGPVAYLLLGRR